MSTRVLLGETPEQATAREVEEAEVVESYLRDLDWSDDVDDATKTLVAGNIRAFAVWYRNVLAARDLPEPEAVECRDCGAMFTTAKDSPGRCWRCGGARKLEAIGGRCEEATDNDARSAGTRSPTTKPE